MPKEFIARNGVIALDNSVITGSLNVTNGITGSIFGTSSFATTATTSSYADNFTVAGTLTAQTIFAQTITSSTDFVTGSTRFGSLLANTHQFTGSVSMTGSLAVTGTANISGNVGIGTTSPYSPLQVGSYTGTGGYSYGIAATFVGGFNVNRGTLFIGSTDTTSTQNKGGSIDFGGGSEAGSTPYTFAKIRGFKETSGADYSGYMSFCTTPAGSDANTERMRINSDGNVGIGTTPTGVNGKLQVSGSIGLSGNSEIRQNTNSDGSTLKILATQLVIGSSNSHSYGYTGGGFIAPVSPADNALLLDAGFTTSTFGRFKIANAVSPNTTISLEKNGVTTLFASTSGWVGIGTTTDAGYKLDVNGTGRFSNTTEIRVNTNDYGNNLLLANSYPNNGIATSISFGHNTQAADPDIMARISGYVDDRTSGNRKGSLRFYTASGGTLTQQLIIASTGAATFSGQVIADSFRSDYFNVAGVGALEIAGTALLHGSSGYWQSQVFRTNGTTRLTIDNTSATFTGALTVQSGLVAPLLFNRITTTYTLVLADQGKMIEANFSTNLVITVPLNLNVAFPIGTEISFVMRNTGTVQIVGEVGFSSVTVNSAGGLNTISTQYGAASLVKVDTNEWYLYGNLT